MAYDKRLVDILKETEGFKLPYENQSRLEDEDTGWKKHFCNHPSHNPPTHIYIPPGKIFIHVCPACGEEFRIHGENSRC